ncbi:hypothetical protein ABIA31_008076 [Catenulispora sp. MAP5-51]|uniref:RICIN domain-containing protein n=1 Tax=Catenulispora sp. MAP5-51 TaxID=3156298 RepID=UPI0035195A11
MPRSRRTLAAALTALTVAAAAAAIQTTASATPPLPPGTTYTVTVGAAGPNNYSTDSPASPFIDKDGTFHTQESASLYGATDPRVWLFDTGTNFDDGALDSGLDNAVNPNNSQDENNNTTWRCNNSPTGLSATPAPPTSTYTQPNYCDLIGTWVDPDTGDWIGLVHNEFTPSPFMDAVHYDSIDYAKSTDQGHTWTITGHAITSPFSTQRGDTVAFPNQTYYFGDGDPRLFVDTASGYFYVYYSAAVLDKFGGGGTWNRLEFVARAPLSGKMAAGSWSKWYNGAWSQPGIGGKESDLVPVDASNPNGYTPTTMDYNPANTGPFEDQVTSGKLPGQSPLLYMNVTYDAYLGLYIAGANPENTSAAPAHAEPLFATDNLATQKWYQISDTGSTLYQDYWYHWFVDSVNRSSGTIVGKTFRSYCDFGCPSGGAEYRNVTIDSTTPAAPPVDPSKTYQIGSGSGRILAQVSGSSATTSIASPTGSTLEAWAFTSDGDGSYTIANAATGQLLGVDSTATANRAWGTRPTATTQGTGGPTVGQQWFFVKNTDASSAPLGSYRLVNRYSGLALGMSSDSTRLAETTPPRYWTDTLGGSVGGTRSDAEQTLSFMAVGTATAVNLALNKPATAQSNEAGHPASLAVDGDPSNNSYWAAGPYSQWWQVDLQGLYNVNNVAVTTYNDGTRYYQYNIQASTDGATWTTIATKNTTAVATSAGDSYPVNVQARYLRVNMTYNSANTSVHIDNFVASGTAAATNLNGTHTIVASGKALDDPNSSRTAGTQLITWPPGGTSNQNWVFTQQPDGSYQIANGLSQLCMEVSGGATTAGAAVIQSTCTGSNSQHWIVTPLTGGGYTIASQKSGLLLTTASITTDGSTVTQQADTGSATQHWAVN